ncbi:hypothetical protein TSAR_001945 [Trichomalopsis sarcophagae]|uniref:Uncharacterized protein n=1 Tax=Trichomalopsis sarcophagae TaxID=543379 RepID=A0A232FDT7_9HYME|nr:hypothetical protein TSAR_001945 [Trichomalopsis sarcophagae]
MALRTGHLLGKNKKCVPGKSYNDSCNTCVCAENKQDERGAWEPIMFCTEMMCFEPDGTEYKPTSAPEDFWQDNVLERALPEIFRRWDLLVSVRANVVGADDGIAHVRQEKKTVASVASIEIGVTRSANFFLYEKGALFNTNAQKLEIKHNDKTYLLQH